MYLKVCGVEGVGVGCIRGGFEKCSEVLLVYLLVELCVSYKENGL